MGYLLIASGGALGSIARYVIGRRIAEKRAMDFPTGTFLVNITGAFLLGSISAAGLDGYMYMLFGEGFLGAFTTFSSLILDTNTLIKDGETLNAFLNVLLSVVIGFMVFRVGVLLGEAL